jgi:hypothetical protein
VAARCLRQIRAQMQTRIADTRINFRAPVPLVHDTLVGIISDTHGLMRPAAIFALRGSDLILHAGDVAAGRNCSMSWAGSLLH